MTPRQKSEIGRLAAETAVYGAFVAVFCLGTVRLLGRPLQTLFRHHRLEYAFLGLALMMAQGLVLERLAHAVVSAFGRRRKAPR
jgi:hypothetical protein